MQSGVVIKTTPLTFRQLCQRLSIELKFFEGLKSKRFQIFRIPSNMLLIVISFVFLSASFVTSQDLKNDEFFNEAYLDFDRSFQIKWSYNETHIIFEV